MYNIFALCWIWTFNLSAIPKASSTSVFSSPHIASSPLFPTALESQIADWFYDAQRRNTVPWARHPESPSANTVLLQTHPILQMFHIHQSHERKSDMRLNSVRRASSERSAASSWSCLVMRKLCSTCHSPRQFDSAWSSGIVGTLATTPCKPSHCCACSILFGLTSTRLLSCIRAKSL